MPYVPGGVSSGLVHLLCRVPGLAIVAVVAIVISMAWSGSNVPTECVPGAMVTFTFDDGYTSTYAKAYPILRQYDYPATVYVITNNVGSYGYMKVFELKELYENGWEIASHTVTHPRLTQLTVQEAEREIAGSKRILEGYGFEAESFSSPFGDYSFPIIELIREHYVSHRTSEPGLNDMPVNDYERYQLKAIVVKTETTVEEVRDWIVRAKEEKKWLILVFHRIDEDGEENWPSSWLEEIVRFVKELEFESVCPKPWTSGLEE